MKVWLSSPSVSIQRDLLVLAMLSIMGNNFGDCMCDIKTELESRAHYKSNRSSYFRKITQEEIMSSFANEYQSNTLKCFKSKTNWLKK